MKGGLPNKVQCHCFICLEVRSWAVEEGYCPYKAK